MQQTNKQMQQLSYSHIHILRSPCFGQVISGFVACVSVSQILDFDFCDRILMWVFVWEPGQSRLDLDGSAWTWMGGAVQPDSVSTHFSSSCDISPLCSSFDILSLPGCRHPQPVDASRNNRVPVFALFPGNSIKAKLTIRIKAKLTSIHIITNWVVVFNSSFRKAHRPPSIIKQSNASCQIVLCISVCNWSETQYQCFALCSVGTSSLHCTACATVLCALHCALYILQLCTLHFCTMHFALCIMYRVVFFTGTSPPPKKVPSSKKLI